MSETTDRAVVLVLRLSETPGRLEDAAPELSERQRRRAVELARDAGLLRHDGGGRWVATMAGRAAAGRMGGF